MTNYFIIDPYKNEISLKCDLIHLSCCYEYIIKKSRLFIFYFSNYDTCRCCISSQMDLISMVANCHIDDMTLVDDVCCDFCDERFDIGISCDDKRCCIHCFSRAKKICESDCCIKYTNQISVFIGQYDDSFHSHIGYIAYDDGIVYKLNLINTDYEPNKYARYYTPNWKIIYGNRTSCVICHSSMNINDMRVCQKCHEFVATRFLRENTVNMLLLREICAKDIVLDICYLIMDKFIGLLRL